MLKQALFLLVLIQSTIIQPIVFLLFKPFSFLFNVKFNWALNAHIFIYSLCGIQHNIDNRATLINRGFVLSNHRSFFDFAFDPYICDASIVGRRAAFYAVSFSYLLGVLDKRMVVINRNKHSRADIFKMMLENIVLNERIVFFPEGTRQSYTALTDADDVKSKLKFGLLKCIYEHKKLPIQMCISSNKEKVFNEKRLSATYDVKVKSCLSKHIHPKDFDTFDAFIDSICAEWFECWKVTHLE